MAEENPPENHYEVFLEEGFESLIFQSQNYAIGLDHDGQPRPALEATGYGWDTLNTPILLLLYLKKCICQLADNLSHPLSPSDDQLTHQLSICCSLIVKIESILYHISVSTAPLWVQLEPRQPADNDNNQPPLQLTSAQQHATWAVFVELGRHLSFYYLRFPLFEDFKDEIAVERSLRSSADSVVRAIERALVSFNLTNLGAFQSIWYAMATKIDGTLQFPLEAVSREVSDDPQAKALQPVYRASIPFIRLARLFLNKMSKPTNSGPHPISLMTHEQHVAILDATHMLDCDAEDFMLGVNIFNPHPDIVNQNSAMGIGIAAFRTLEIFSGFLDTLESDPSSDRKFTQYWRDWFGGWSNSLGVAADRYRAALTAAVTSIQT
ncbi:hypothetical protein MJO28_016717 [Puccinia striiformis f. sp. tritici]|uniref:Uncharacterized protein n=4 Tax=Puccinia striiformis TaxID=27350 RepID=A0A0L0V404_9BASI|nr:hypothetical protein Pst134EA_030205 [Puccinia striiformis f. sp. tritici]KAI9600264.1 hypothetical protein H4Q26_000042 [Puccinia striiformis f. sp. tritici PST-130]KNE93997.1 hypothetical protein PSTG_12663 [Puccinia striiformis f. sp. tritici PST-78]POW06534.1 hypothetical protein PSTT_08934 [Puccinia striiformis]KAH9440128.1 hypothetical protein Pst134EB_030758 [Puccinia striiformis f. sp. tritici]KAH9446284.1 hypothetical protein Pst134EA_030205 [Puccinia striiformis f. sp. tritici]